MAQTIATRISFEGADDIKAKLEALGKAGADAFEQIRKAAGDVGLDKLGQEGEKAAEGLAKTGDASQQTGKQLDTVKTSADRASESMSNLSLETVRVSSEIAKNAAEFTKTAVEIGLAVAKHESLTKTLVRFASESITAVRVLGLLQVALGSTAVAIGVAGVAAVGAAIGIEALGAAAAASAKSYDQLNHTLQMLSQSSGQSFDSLQRGEALFGRIGISAETFRSTIGKVGEAIKDLNVGEKLKKSADDVIAAERALIDLYQPAGLALQSYTAEVDKTKEAEDKLAAARANNMAKLVPLVKAIEAGQKGITFDSLVTAQSKIDAFNISLKQAQEAGKDAGQVILQFIAAADRASAIQIGKNFGLSEEDVDRVQRLKGGVAALNEEAKRLKAAGVLIPPASAAALAEMRTEIQATENAWTRLNQAWASSVFPTIAARIVALIEPLKQGFINMAAAALEATNVFFRMPEAFIAISVGIAAVVAIFGGPLLIVIAAVGAALVALAAYWPQISAAAQQAWNIIKADAEVVSQFIMNWVTTPIGNAWAWIKDTFNEAVNWIGSKIEEAKAWIEKWVTTPVANAWKWIADTFRDVLKSLTGGGGTSSGIPPDTSGGGFASGGLLGGRGTGTSDSNLAWLSRGEFVMPARAVQQPGVLALLEWLRRSGGGIPGFASGGLNAETSSSDLLKVIGKLLGGMASVRRIIDGIADQVGSLTFLVIDSMQGVMRTIDSMLSSFSNSCQQIIANLKTASDTLFELEDVGKHASGGLIGGRGTGTSDSNLALVSRGEHIMPARAVAQPGVLAFLEALRRSGGDLSRVLNGLGRFAMGGPVGLPAFASGGLGGMNHVTIAFPGLPAISGLRASSDVVAELQRSAAMAQVRSGGRKPSRYT